MGEHATARPGWLDRLPRPVRHLVIMAASGLLGWTAQEALPAAGPWLAAHEPLGPLVGVAAMQLLLVALPLVRSYGASWERGTGEPGT
jgi:hypothetical protein